MRAAAHNEKFSKKIGIPQKVAKEYEKADAAKPSKHKHPGNLGEAMRANHNTKRMDYVRAHKGKD